jgi:hypothetical protein
MRVKAKDVLNEANGNKNEEVAKSRRTHSY